ncbi:aminoglycoside phosphotransferase family protein [Nocardioides sp. NPDC127514]|uniref:phosphotransferase family protein n=1 Tax=unclassified Nocardioides TaxID=2615069 RepID=UPI0033307D46
MSEVGVAAEAIPRAAQDFLVDAGLATGDDVPVWTPLTGGVSSELWHVRIDDKELVVKGALAKLKVAGDWRAPTSRNAVEWDWLVYAHDVAPGGVPVPLAHDVGRGLFAMSFLAPEEHPVWKAQLMAGTVRPRDAAAVGDLVGRLHARSSNDDAAESHFRTDDNFHVLRIEPYLLATARRHPDLTGHLEDIVAVTTSTHHALVHGDVSPKNILIGPSGPVLLDAECAWYGDPAFDLAFVLTHLVLKAVIRPKHQAQLRAAGHALLEAYGPHVSWEPLDDVLARGGRLLPALLLARIDGTSPVEYLDSAQQARVRNVARALLGASMRIDDVLDEAFTRLRND